MHRGQPSCRRAGGGRAPCSSGSVVIIHPYICIYAYRHLGEEDHDPAHEAQPVDVSEHTPPVPRLEHLELARREARQPLLTLALGEGLAHAARGRHLVRVRARARARVRARARG